MVLIIVGVLIWNFSTGFQGPDQPMTFSDFIAKVDAGEIEEVTITGSEITGTLKVGVDNKFRTFEKIHDVFLEHVMAHAPGYDKLIAWTDADIMPTPGAVGDILQRIAERDRLSVPTESLLMESARRIDEWGRIAAKIPNTAIIPSLAPVAPDHETQLDLLPHEWEVLAMIDGERDLKAIAATMGREEFEIAKIAYGLVTTGVIDVRQPKRLSISTPGSSVSPEVLLNVERGFAAAREGDLASACASWEKFLRLAPEHRQAARVKSALEGATRLLAAMEAHGND